MLLNLQKVFLGLVVLTAFSPAIVHADDEIRIELPTGAELKVRNDFGNVSAEIWRNSYVAVSAVIEGSASFSRSPILVDNRGSLLTISVVRRPFDPVVPVHLHLKIPESSSMDVVTTSGTISLVGLPRSALLRSATGALHASLRPDSNADVTARSAQGTVNSHLGAEASAVSRDFQTRLGTGGNKLDLQTETGEILLNYAAVNQGSSTARRTEPQLIGKYNAMPAAESATGPQPGDDLSEGDVIRVDSQLVTLNVSVIDRSTNRGLPGLVQSDFKLFEDGQEQRVIQFESATAPFDLILLIDLSGSTREVVELIRASALRFVDAARPADRIGVITFAGQPILVSELTADRQLLRKRIETIDTVRGDTKLYDATNFAMAELSRQSKRSRRTAIVLMSDGLDGIIPGISGQQGSRNSYEETLRNIQEFDGVLYALWLNTEYEAMSPLDTQPEAFDAGHDRMKQMADAGGGVFYEVERLKDLAGAYEQVVADLGTTYSLAYRPSNSARDGSWRTIRIAVDRPHAAPRGKRGYYAY